jgi:hypothetical protein
MRFQIVQLEERIAPSHGGGGELFISHTDHTYINIDVDRHRPFRDIEISHTDHTFINIGD